MTSKLRSGWLFLFALGLFAVLSGCSSEAPTAPMAGPADQDEPGSTRGELVSYIATFDDGTSETTHYLRIASGEERQLFFHEPVTVDPGTSIRVWGADAGNNAIDVTQYRIVELPSPTTGIGSSSSALVAPVTLANRNFCVVLVNLNGTALTVTADQAAQQFFSGPTSINAFYRENSYGAQGVDGAVFGPFDYTMAACANADTNNMATAMRAAVTAAAGAQTCTQYAYIFSRTTICAFGGLGALGSPLRPARDTWYNGSISCVVTVQEPGHNFGMQHSSSMQCGTTTAPTTFDDSLAACVHSEYGDPFDPMGSGCRHMNIWQKEYEQWFGDCNSVKVTSSGTFNLFPTELPCDGPQALQIPFATPRPFTRPAGGGGAAGTDTLTSYYLEYRMAAGFDRTMTPLPTVLLHVGADYKTPVAGARQNTGIHTWLLDMHPVANARNQFTDAGFRVGETFTDPAGGITITVTAMDAQKATVQVDMPNGTGGPTCLDGTAFDPAAATSCSTTVVGTDAGPPVIIDAGGVVTGAGGAGGARADAGRDAAAGLDAAAEAGRAGAGGAGGAGGDTTIGVGGALVADGSSAGASGSYGPTSDGSVTIPSGNSDASPSSASPDGNTGVQGECGCRVGADSSPVKHGGSLAGLALLAVAAGRRRRGSRRQTRPRSDLGVPRMRRTAAS